MRNLIFLVEVKFFKGNINDDVNLYLSFAAEI